VLVYHLFTCDIVPLILDVEFGNSEIARLFLTKQIYVNTHKLVYNDPQNSGRRRQVVVVQRSLCSNSPKWDLTMMAVIGRWSLFGSGR